MDTRKTVTFEEAKAHFSALIDEAAVGREITITKKGKAVAMLNGAPPKLGATKKTARIVGAFGDHGPALSKQAWLDEWAKSDTYVAKLFAQSGKGSEKTSKNAKLTKAKGRSDAAKRDGK
jgi:prevent-host-death family protein